MDPQENGQNVVTPAAGNPGQDVQPGAPVNTQDNGNIDLSAYMGDDGHTLDFNKVAELYKNAEKYKTSAAFFQTKYQQVCQTM